MKLKRIAKTVLCFVITFVMIATTLPLSEKIVDNTVSAATTYSFKEYTGCIRL